MQLKDLVKLGAQESFPRITLQIPLFLTIPERNKNEAIVQDALKAVQDLLDSNQVPQKNEILARLRKEALGIDFMHIKPGLLLLADANTVQRIDLPFSLPLKAVIAARYDLADIIKTLSHLKKYWILLLARKPSRLFVLEGDIIQEIIEPEADAWNITRDGFPFEYTKPEERYGHALAQGDKDAAYQEEHRKHFFHKVDQLFHKFANQHPFPTIVIGDREDLSYFMETSHHRGLVVGQVYGSYSQATADSLKARVAPAIKQHEESEAQELFAQFLDAVGKSKHAMGIEWVQRVAHEGRVHKVLIEEDFQRPEIDDIISTVINKGGTVTMVKPGLLKDYQHIVAIERY